MNAFFSQFRRAVQSAYSSPDAALAFLAASPLQSEEEKRQAWWALSYLSDYLGRRRYQPGEQPPEDVFARLWALASEKQRLRELLDVLILVHVPPYFRQLSAVVQLMVNRALIPPSEDAIDDDSSLGLLRHLLNRKDVMDALTAEQVSGLASRIAELLLAVESTAPRFSNGLVRLLEVVGSHLPDKDIHRIHHAAMAQPEQHLALIMALGSVGCRAPWDFLMALSRRKKGRRNALRVTAARALSMAAHDCPDHPPEVDELGLALLYDASPLLRSGGYSLLPFSDHFAAEVIRLGKEAPVARRYEAVLWLLKWVARGGDHPSLRGFLARVLEESSMTAVSQITWAMTQQAERDEVSPAVLWAAADAAEVVCRREPQGRKCEALQRFARRFPPGEAH